MEKQVRPLTLLKNDDDKREAWAEAVEQAGGQPTAKQVEAAVAKRQPPKKDHPAPFSDPIVAEIARRLPTEGIVVDPFAGTGRIHEFATDQRKTVGIEIEQEWADKHTDTIHGDALVVLAAMEPESVDAIVTSPTYGNRMADHHDAKDDSVRLTYKHTLGHDLADNNSGAMQWGDEYRTFHRQAWAEAVAALKPGGTFTINIKNHYRDGVEQPVVEWHIDTLCRGFNLELIKLGDGVGTRGLMAGANATNRTAVEQVITFRKPSL
jgi:DNA modification methylase